MNTKTLQLLSQKKQGVEVVLFTENGHGNHGFLTTEVAYHCGASSKDAGKRLCAINKLENTGMVHPVIDKLLLNADKVI